MSSAKVTNNNETSKIQCRIVSPQVIDENQSLFLILTRFLMSSVKVIDKKTTQLLWLLIKFPPKCLVFHREKTIHSYLSKVK